MRQASDPVQHARILRIWLLKLLNLWLHRVQSTIANNISVHHCFSFVIRNKFYFIFETIEPTSCCVIHSVKFYCRKMKCISSYVCSIYIALQSLVQFALADLGGVPGTSRDQILSFSHTFSPKSTHVRGWHPPNGSKAPYGKSWIRHWFTWMNECSQF